MSALFNLARGGVDRDAPTRARRDVLEALRESKDARFLLVQGDCIAATDRALAWVGGEDFAALEREEHDVGRLRQEAIYLGRAYDRPYFAVDMSETSSVNMAETSSAISFAGAELLNISTQTEGKTGEKQGEKRAGTRERPEKGTREKPEKGSAQLYRSVRSYAHVWSAADSTLASEAVAICNWLRGAQFCERCGNPLNLGSDGWHKRCQAGHISFPRTDPAVIMAITDPDGRLLLGHNAQWEPNKFSILAGFVEAGEPAEETVVRETWEETSIHVDRVSYVGSQPWPFPRSLMLAFEASTSESNEHIKVDGVEMAYAHFYDRAEFVEAIRAAQIIPPSPASVAAALIERWLGESYIKYAKNQKW